MVIQSSVRCKRIKNEGAVNAPGDFHNQHLTAMEMHGRGIGAKAEARRRGDADARCVAMAFRLGQADAGRDGWTKPALCGARSEHPALAIRSAWRTHMAANKAGIRANADGALHLICIVSPEWLRETGDPHDPENPRVMQLVNAARDWAERSVGGVFAVRFDVDEGGSGAVDVFAAPIREQGRRGSRRPFVAVTQALNELRREHNQKLSFTALQDSWWKYAKRHLSPDIQRGKPKAETQREHLEPEEYAAMLKVEAHRGRQRFRKALAKHRLRKRGLKLASRAIRDAIEWIRHDRGGEVIDLAEKLCADAEAVIDRADPEAIERLADRYEPASPAMQPDRDLTR